MNEDATRTHFPLTDAQLGVFLSWSAAPAATAYNLPSCIALGATDPKRLREALLAVVAARPVLHTRFVNVGGEPRQYADMQMPIPVRILRMSDAKARRYIRQGFVRPFQPYGKAPLCRFEILVTPTARFLLTDISHAIADGLTLSRWLLGRDLPDAFAGRTLVPEAADAFRLAEAEQALRDTPAMQEHEAWLMQRLGDATFTRLSHEAPKAGRLLTAEVCLPRRATEAACRRQRLRPEELFLGAFTLAVGKLALTERPAFCLLHHGRTLPGAMRSYGMFVRSLPFAADVSGTLTKPLFFQRLRDAQNDTLLHADYPATRLYAQLGTSPALTFGYQSAAIRENLCLGADTLRGEQLPRKGVRGDLSCTVYVGRQHFHVRMEGGSGLHTKEHLLRLARAVRRAAECLVEEGGRLKDITLCDERERAELLRMAWGRMHPVRGSGSLLPDILAICRTHAAKPAIVDAAGSMSYGELAEAVERRAEAFREMGVREGDLLSVPIARTRAFIVDALAAWRCDAAFCPQAEGTAPQDVSILAHGLPTQGGGTAYVMHTSGSTGRPKGVIISHDALRNLTDFIRRTWPVRTTSRTACHASFAFDAAMEDIFPTLTAGATLYIVPEHLRRDPEGMRAFIRQHAVTGGCYTTSFGLELASQDIVPDYLCLGGERLTRLPLTHARTQTYNTYGPTEFCVDATYHVIDPARRYRDIPIGRPVDNCAAFVTDLHGQLVPRGLPGELWLAGPQMATGYLDDDRLTEQRFVRCAFRRGKAYRTGDVVRWNSQDELCFLGRKDRQLKLRGYRIEPAQVEDALLRVEGITAAVVEARRLAGQGAATDERTELCAFFTASRPLRAADIRAQLRPLLPAYMLPTRFMQLDRLPTTPSGKVDVRRLPTPALALTPSKPPRNATERSLCEAFGQVLGTSEAGRTTDFFEAGGTSLMALELVAMLKRSGLAVAYGDVFSHPTPARLADVIRKKGAKPATARAQAKPKAQNVRPQPLPTAAVAPEASFLLTGATGYLGAHVLRGLLVRGAKRIACLVRTPETAAGTALRDALSFYFGNAYAQEAMDGGRIVTFPGDISESGTWEHVPGEHYDCVIHCAADVRQFARGTALQQTNVVGTEQAVNYCLRTGATLVHVSTTSVGGILPRGIAANTMLSEDMLDIGQQLPTEYVRTKYEAERLVREAIRDKGLRARIVRVGNLAPRHEDGRFQRDVARCGLVQLLLAMRQDETLARALGTQAVDFSPVDMVAERLLGSLCASADGTTSHIFNCKAYTLAQLAPLMQPVLQAPGLHALPVPHEALALLRDYAPVSVARGKHCFEI